MQAESGLHHELCHVLGGTPDLRTHARVDVRIVMTDSPPSPRICRPDQEDSTFEDVLPVLAGIDFRGRAVPACAGSRHLRGTALPVDLGMSTKYSGA